MAIDVHQGTMRLLWEKNGELVMSLDALQGHWTDEQYLLLSAQTNRLLEYTDGFIEVLPMPTDIHQVISRLLLFKLFAFVQRLGGTVLYAPLRMRIRAGKFREPDLLVLCSDQDPRRQDAFWLGADLVVEIVSPDRPERDTEEKPLDYAEAGIPEYWIVNPLTSTITVLVLDEGSYREHGVFQRGERAHSQLLVGFSISVDEVFDAR